MWYGYEYNMWYGYEYGCMGMSMGICGMGIMDIVWCSH